MKIIKINDFRDIPCLFTGIVECSDDSKYYYVDDKLHRIDGPAVEFPHGKKRYYIDGKLVSKEAQELLFWMMKLKGINN